MAQLRTWELPLNPPNPYALYLQYLTNEFDGKLHYTKYIVNVIGELDLNKTTRNVREWEIPPQILGTGYLPGNPAGITHDQLGHVWFALESSHRLVELDPATGTFVAYGGPQLPVRYPRHLMFDGTGALWYTGAGSQGALIGRLDPNRKSATIWDLPIEFLTPEGIWTEPAGETVWFTPVNPNVYMTGAFLGRLSGSNLDYWSVPKGGARPMNAGVVGEPANGPQNVWFTYAIGGSQSRTYRLHRPSATFYEYEPVSASPRKITLDADRNAWISDWSGKVSMIRAEADCGTADFDSGQFQVQPRRMRVRAESRRVKPRGSSVAPVTSQVPPTKDKCYRNLPLPYPLASNGIQVTDVAGRPTVYFSQGSGRTIGELIP